MEFYQTYVDHRNSGSGPGPTNPTTVRGTLTKVTWKLWVLRATAPLERMNHGLSTIHHRQMLPVSPTDCEHCETLSNVEACISFQETARRTLFWFAEVYIFEWTAFLDGSTLESVPWPATSIPSGGGEEHFLGCGGADACTASSKSWLNSESPSVWKWNWSRKIFHKQQSMSTKPGLDMWMDFLAEKAPVGSSELVGPCWQRHLSVSDLGSLRTQATQGFGVRSASHHCFGSDSKPCPVKAMPRWGRKTDIRHSVKLGSGTVSTPWNTGPTVMILGKGKRFAMLVFLVRFEASLSFMCEAVS